MNSNTPEKIYIQSFNNSEENTLCFDAVWTEQPESGQENIEYTRTDAFIKKACNAYCKVCKMPNCMVNECKLISDFKGYL